MGMKWFCDVTGKEVFLNPEYEQVLDTKCMPVMTKQRSMDSNGKLRYDDVPKIKYKQEKGYFLRLDMGGEQCSLTLSEEGVQKFKPLASQLMSAMEAELKK